MVKSTAKPPAPPAATLDEAFKDFRSEVTKQTGAARGRGEARPREDVPRDGDDGRGHRRAHGGVAQSQIPVRVGVVARPPVPAPERSAARGGMARARLRGAGAQRRAKGASCSSISARFSRCWARRRARSRCSWSSRQTPASIATSRRGLSASHGSRPEADHSYPEPAVVRGVFPRGGIHSRRRAVVGVLGSQPLRRDAPGARGVPEQSVCPRRRHRRRRHHGAGRTRGARVAHPGENAPPRRRPVFARGRSMTRLRDSVASAGRRARAPSAPALRHRPPAVRPLPRRARRARRGRGRRRRGRDPGPRARSGRRPAGRAGPPHRPPDRGTTTG